MKIIKFRIKNYKSIKDSEDCYLYDKITILAGKNETGKTVMRGQIVQESGHKRVIIGSKWALLDSCISKIKGHFWDFFGTFNCIKVCQLLEKGEEIENRI
ncbi:MAG: hypothetical protein ACE5K0_01295 [Candidatus Methanofastidiosia archaeon]